MVTHLHPALSDLALCVPWEIEHTSMLTLGHAMMASVSKDGSYSHWTSELPVLREVSCQNCHDCSSPRTTHCIVGLHVVQPE